MSNRWPWLLLVSGVCGLAGGLLHPDEDPALTGDAALASWVGNPQWIPSHMLILASTVLLVPGLYGLARSLTGAARKAAWTSFGAALVWVVESIPHLLAAADHHALLAGQPAPFLTGHLAGAVLVYPLAGFSLAALAVLGGRALAHPALNAAGAVGGAAFGIAPIAVGPLGIDALGVLFGGMLLVTTWVAAVGATALLRRRTPMPEHSA
ncbi:hypothetical protein ACU61A_30370 [Pseudonocardia sichuanensis]